MRVCVVHVLCSVPHHVRVVGCHRCDARDVRRLSFDERVDVEYMARFITGVQQRYTQSGGRRPFGISALIAGFSPLGEPCLFQTDPSGNYAAWKASHAGRLASLHVTGLSLCCESRN